ncbi:MAG: hypothetical protein ABL982_03515 [Vicinamibacterales bacterium]
MIETEREQIQVVVDRLNEYAAFGCEGDFGDETCSEAEPDDPAEWCGRCIADNAATGLQVIAAGALQVPGLNV